MMGLPSRKYNIIYADPPWAFSSKEAHASGGGYGPLERHYPTQSTEWIKRLPVGGVAAKDCALFLWTTDAHIPSALEVVASWGFRYVTVAFVWEKFSSRGRPACTLGAWTLKGCELCLLGTKGSMLKHKKSNRVRQKVNAERTKHSRKPGLVRDGIESLFGDLPRIELFAREKCAGWDAWGDEVTPGCAR